MILYKDSITGKVICIPLKNSMLLKSVINQVLEVQTTPLMRNMGFAFARLCPSSLALGPAFLQLLKSRPSFLVVARSAACRALCANVCKVPSANTSKASSSNRI